MSREAPGTPPRVSVIIPCHNHGQYLDEAVASVLAQTYQDFEILVVNDGSTDSATHALLADYRQPRTRVIQTPHVGLGAARNLGIAQAAGSYLCALDADDRLEPSFLAMAVPVLDRDPSITFVSSWLRTFGDEHWEWTPKRCDLPTLLWEDTILTAAVVRRDAVLAVGGYDAAMPVQGDEDWDLWLTLVERGHLGVILPEVLFNYRRRAGSMSTVCWQGAGHMPLARYRIAKHRETYQTHLLDVLLHQDEETAALLRKNDEIERYVASTLEPAVTMRREELVSLRARLACQAPDAGHTRRDPDASPRISDLEAALGAAEAEIRAFRASASWRVTRPLRDVYGWWLRRRRSE